MKNLKERLENACARVQVWLKADPLRSQAALARSIGVSGSALSGTLAGKYTGNTGLVVEKLERFFEMETQKLDLLPDPEYAKTRNAKRIHNFVAMVHLQARVGVMIGSSGIGKTMALVQYARDANARSRDRNQTVYYIPINPMIRSKGAFFRALSQRVLGDTTVKDEYSTFERIANRVSTQNGLIILDDAHLLYTEKSTNDSPFEIVRTLNDRGFGFIISGNPSLRDKVTETHHMEFYQQLASRSKLLQVNHAFSEGDVRDIIEPMLGGVRIRREVFDYLFALANRYYGSLRMMVNTLQLAAFNANSMNEPLSLSHLESACEHNMLVEKPEFRNSQKAKRRVHGKKAAGADREQEHGEEEPASAAG